MVKELISSILEAEEQAETIVKDASAKSREKMVQAEEQAKKIRTEASELIKSERKAKYDATAVKADELYEAELAKAQEDSLAMKQLGSKNKDAAVDFIVGRIIA